MANVAASNWTVNSTSNASLVAGRFAGQAFQHTGTSQRYLERAIPATNTLSLGVAIRIGDITDLAEQTSLLSFFNASAQLQIAIDITVTGQIIALRGATGLGTSAEEAPIFEDGVWRYIEVELFINDATGYVKVYRDGALILNVENVDTQNQSGDDIGVVRMWGCEAGNAVSVFAYDDIYCTNDGTRLGECRVSTLVPTSDTADVDWTPLGAGDHYAEVDDDDGDTSYIASATPGDLDMFGLGDLPFTPTTIYAIQTTFRARKDDVATREIRAKIRSNGTTDEGATEPLASNYLYYHDVFEQDPDTTAAWAAAAVDTLEVGVETVT